MLLAPDNQTNGGSATLGADLPYKSRYMGTFSYNVGTQNNPFLPFGSSPVVLNAANVGVAAPTAMPASSLNGQINTLLSNNVLTTQITPELKNKANYRIYDFDNNTPQKSPIGSSPTPRLASITGANNSYAPVRRLPVAYTKQNAGDELVWRPNHNWNVGTAFGWERYDWKFEFRRPAPMSSRARSSPTGNPTSDLTVRGSWLLASRTYSQLRLQQQLGQHSVPRRRHPGHLRHRELLHPHGQRHAQRLPERARPRQGADPGRLGGGAPARPVADRWNAVGRRPPQTRARSA